MKKIFSPTLLRTTGVIALGLLIIYILLQILPYLAPAGRVLKAVLFPVFIALIIAYLVTPLVEMLMKLGLNRLISILLIYILFFGGLGFLFWYGAPVFIEQLKELLEEWPRIQLTLYEWGGELRRHMERLPLGIHQGIDDAIFRIQADSKQSVGKVIEGASSILDRLFAFFVIPFLVFYFLQDAEMMNRTVFHLIPSSKRKMTFELWKDIDHSLGEYVRGQIIVSVIVGILSLVGYLLIGLPYSLFLSAVMAIVNIIPYFGPLIGIAPALLIAMLTKPVLVVWVIVINIIIQIIEGNVIAPWVMGKRLQIHPVFIILALLIGNETGGMIGLILAVPIFVVLKVILVHIVQHARNTHQNAWSDD